MLIIPAIAIGAYMLWHLNEYYSVLQSQWFIESFFLAAGIVSGCLFYSFRFRFITTVLPLVLLLFIIGKIVSNIYTGEFIAFYAITKFYIFSFLFLTGWFCGWGFARLRWFPVMLAIVLLLVQIIVVSNTTDITAQKLVIAFVPVLVFAFYIIYTSELVRNMNDDEPRFSWFIAKKLAGFVAVAGIILLLIFSFFKKDFKAIEKEYGGGQNEKQEPNKESLTKEDKDGTVSNKKEMGLSGGRKSTKRLVFIAKLDNYFPNTEIPNPLYFTYDYYTKFDTQPKPWKLTASCLLMICFNQILQKFRCILPKLIPSVLVKAKGILKRKVVSTEVYKALLSPKEYLAPGTAFFASPLQWKKNTSNNLKVPTGQRCL